MVDERLLRDKGIKVTQGRLKILDILIKNKEALTAEEIYRLCREEDCLVNFSTVYRVLEVFEKKSIVDKFPQNHGVFVFKLKGEEHKHFLECDMCHKEVEVPCPMKQIEDIVAKDTGFTLTEHNLVMKGICEECKNR